MSAIEKLLHGYHAFFERYFDSDDTTYTQLAEGQQPKVLIIACCDSRVSPYVITQANPGELFTVRNVANLVPPYKHDEGDHHGVSSAIEFAVTVLGVEHIIVMGHSQCGGIHALLTEELPQESFITSWMEIGQAAKEAMLKELPDAEVRVQAKRLEELSVIYSLENLKGFPFVAEKLDTKQLRLHGWHFVIGTGELRILDEQKQAFTAYQHRGHLL